MTEETEVWKTSNTKQAAALLACGHRILDVRRLDGNRYCTFIFAVDETLAGDYYAYITNQLMLSTQDLNRAYERTQDAVRS